MSRIVEVKIKKESLPFMEFSGLVGKRLFWEIGLFSDNGDPIIHDEKGMQEIVGKYDVVGLDGRELGHIQWIQIEKKSIKKALWWNLAWCLWWGYMAVVHYTKYGMQYYLPFINIALSISFGYQAYKSIVKFHKLQQGRNYLPVIQMKEKM